MNILILLISGTLQTACFLIGAKVGQKVVKGEAVELPCVNPLQLIEKRKKKQEAKEEQHKIETILHNIEAYDGTAFRQEDV